MVSKPIIPAIINTSIYSSINLYDRRRIIHLIISKFRDIIKYDLGLSQERILIRCSYGGDIVCKEYTTEVIANVNHKSPYIITIYIDKLIQYTSHLTFKQLCRTVINVLAHEYRHVYQAVNNTYGHFPPIYDIQNYILNYDSIEVEVDACEYSNKFLFANDMLIKTCITQCLAFRLRDYSNYNKFDIYHFLNQLKIQSPDMYRQLCIFITGNDKNIVFLPTYNNTINIVSNCNEGVSTLIFCMKAGSHTQRKPALHLIVIRKTKYGYTIQ